MPNLSLPLDFPLKIRGIKGVIFITPLSPLTLRGEFIVA
jgi:hypothetical protein